MDCLWFGLDDNKKSIAEKQQKFFYENQNGIIDGVYLIDGTKVKDKALHPIGLLSTLAEASIISEGPYAKELVKRFWNTPLRTGDRRYYDNCLYFFAVLALSGRYRIWL